jgi:hypothetical protein
MIMNLESDQDSLVGRGELLNRLAYSYCICWFRAGSEVCPDVEPEVCPEVGSDVCPDAEPEVCPDVYPEVCPEVGPDSDQTSG